MAEGIAAAFILILAAFTALWSFVGLVTVWKESCGVERAVSMLLAILLLLVIYKSWFN